MSRDGADGESIADASDRLERMWVEIGLRLPKAGTATIQTPADDALWDAMQAHFETCAANGWISVLDNDTGPEHPGMWIVRTFQAPVEPGETVGDGIGTDGDRVPVEPNLETVSGPDGE